MPQELVAQTDFDAPLELVGGKGKGLLQLKALEGKLSEQVYNGRAYVPSFFIVPMEIDLLRQHSAIVSAARGLGTDRFAVRSSSALEDTGEHSFDGIFSTERGVNLDNLVRAAHKVRKSALSEKARDYAKDVGVELTDSIPVIVQADVSKSDFTGVVYSKFPSPHNIVKVIRDSSDDGKRYIDAFKRVVDRHNKLCHDSQPFLFSKIYNRGLYPSEQSLAQLALLIEHSFGYPVIMEFAFVMEVPKYGGKDMQVISLIQARRLTNLSDAMKFQMPELQDKGLVGFTYGVNGTGDITGEAFVVRVDNYYRWLTTGLKEFDEQHRDKGYILVTHHLQRDDCEIDSITPNKKAILAYDKMGDDHGFEISRKKGILYLNCHETLSESFRSVGKSQDFRDMMVKAKLLIGRDEPIKTGDTIRLVSDGARGFVYNLSR